VGHVVTHGRDEKSINILDEEPEEDLGIEGRMLFFFFQDVSILF
jgi:hypothetical protein